MASRADNDRYGASDSRRSRVIGTTAGVANHKGYEVYEALVSLTCEECMDAQVAGPLA